MMAAGCARAFAMIVLLGLLVAADCGGGGTTPPCDPSIASVNVAPGVDYYDCSATQTNVHVVTIDRARGSSEMWVLDDPTGTPGTLNLHTVEDFTRRYNAVVAINGYIWDGDFGVPLPGTGRPLGTLFETGQQVTPNTAHCDGFPDPCPQVFMGFASGGLDVKRIPEAIFGDDPDNVRFLANLYASNTSVMIGGQCTNDARRDNWSVIGYSATDIVLFTFGSGVVHADMCPVLAAFGVTEAVRQDGASAAELFIDRAQNVNIVPVRHLGQVRGVAFALGLVDLTAVAVTNAGFEAPVLAPGQAWQRMNGGAVTGWQGSVDLHSGTDLLALGAQIVDLNQDSTGYIETTLALPADTYCAVRFHHGVNHHCNQTATFDVQIDGVTVRSVTSTYDPAALQESAARFRTEPGATSTTLRFQSTTGGCGAATIDDVSVACTR